MVAERAIFCAEYKSSTNDASASKTYPCTPDLGGNKKVANLKKTMLMNLTTKDILLAIFMAFLSLLDDMATYGYVVIKERFR